mmetsp:Transcript_23350/g.28099  ORF Transcript_23350/g.28099 Transcript_23350/m.28099 type:complete len:250 (-) Transcript_23350:56-805(-)
MMSVGRSPQVLLASLLAVALWGSTGTHGLAPPPLGLGAIFFRPAGMNTRPSLGDEKVLVEAADFFTDAFWAGKVGGGIQELLDFQRKSIRKQQVQEFRKRYGAKMNKREEDRRSELLITTNGAGELMGCAGLEVDRIPATSLTDSQTMTYAPLMSNLAVGNKFRRRGIAEELVKKAEELARKEWGCNECYLYVEKRNKPAIKLYGKLGYRKVWEDDSARTLIPNETGGLQNTGTTIVCMKKKMGGLFSF